MSYTPHRRITLSRDKLALVMPWILVAALIGVADASLAMWNRRRVNSLPYKSALRENATPGCDAGVILAATV